MEDILQGLEEEFDFLMNQLSIVVDHDELMKLSGRAYGIYSTIKLLKDDKNV
jgi:hypothetical protein